MPEEGVQQSRRGWGAYFESCQICGVPERRERVGTRTEQGLPKPERPLLSVFNISDVAANFGRVAGTFVFNFYSIAIKRGFEGKLKYGQNYYDFDEGVMAFMAPGQVLTVEASDDAPKSGWILFFHPEFLRGYSLGKKIKEYGFFSYAANEALHLSEKEENAGATAYSCSKAAQLAFTKMAALELAKHKIRVNVICPGAIDTEIDDSSRKRDVDKAQEPAEYPAGKIPLTDGKPGTARTLPTLYCFSPRTRLRTAPGHRSGSTGRNRCCKDNHVGTSYADRDGRFDGKRRGG